MGKITSLSIDIECYSDVDLSKCGVYKYASSPAFEVLLFGVSVNKANPVVYDLASGEQLPGEIINALNDETVIKSAWNCAFERVCISRYLHDNGRFEDGYGDPDDTVGEYLDPVSWRDTALVSAYNSLPLSLKGAGEVLFSDEDSRKMSEGADLIRYFCKPCKPTKANGGRTRNLPADAPEKWELFKKYNCRDVEVEMHIQDRLTKYPVPDQVWKEFFESEKINDRGVLVDREFVQQAVRLDGITKEKLMQQLQELTGLENPNSVIQMKAWLDRQGVRVESLGKKDVQKLITETSGTVNEVLKLRLQLAKSSVKKYQTMLNAACPDGRARGMFRFYGANHTGRFSGHIIQLQNLYRNSMPDLEEARMLVRSGDYDALSLLYDDIPDTLSQLIRTSFIPGPGCKFIVSDYAAIEARVIAYIAGEQWRIDAFREGKDIYCAAASQMFGVPVVKHGINGHLRGRGKTAELACIAHDELVLTDRGLVPIQNVALKDRLWDGEEWVEHEGVIFKGEGEVITYEGLTATADHYVWVQGQEDPIQLSDAARSGAHLLQTGDGRTAVRLENHNKSGIQMDNRYSVLCGSMLYGMRGNPMGGLLSDETQKSEELSSLYKGAQLAEISVEGSEAQMRKPKRPRVSTLWGKRNKVRFSKCERCRHMDCQESGDSRQRVGDGSYRHERKLCSGEYPICIQKREHRESQDNRDQPIRTEILAIREACSNTQAGQQNDKGRNNRGCEESSKRTQIGVAPDRRKARLYDIRNAGRHHRFTVSGRLVHNCGYGGGVGALKAMGALENGMKEEELQPTVDAWRAASPHIVQLWSDFGSAAVSAIQERTSVESHGMVFSYRGGMLFVTLPSGRQLAYAKPKVEYSEFGRLEITYEGIGSVRKWTRLKTWGGKITENNVQAFARDVLCYAILNLKKYHIVMHIHDEVVVEVPEEVKLEEITRIMGQTPIWAEGLVLRADGYECRFYQKD